LKIQKFDGINSRLTKLNKKLNGLKSQIEESKSIPRQRFKVKQLKEEFSNLAITFEKVTNQALVLERKLENNLIMAENAAHALSVGVSIETFVNGLSVDGNVLTGPFQN
jgi:archaellum component FlaC